MKKRQKRRRLLLAVGIAALAATTWGGGFDVSGTDPATLPAVPAGFTVTMPAREPLVRNVSMLAFDTRGRLFVAMGPQYRHPKETTPGDTVAMLVDADGDGTFDQAKSFAGPFHCVQGMAWKQGPRGSELWVANAPDLTVARDTDGDGQADEYVRIATGLGTLEHALDAPSFAPDGYLYFGKGDTPVFGNAPRAFRDLAQVEAGAGAVDDPEPVTFAQGQWPAAWRASYRFPTDGHTGGGILRCDASGRNLAIVCRGCRNPWGMAFDDGFDWLATDQDDLGGDRFLMPFMGAHFGMRHRWNNSWTGEGTLASVPASGPIAEGSGTGVLFYDSPEFPESHRNVFYRADWLRGALEIFRREWQGALLMPAGGRVEPFVSLGDKKPLFRPTAMAIGPDGALWIGGWGSTYGWNGDKTEGRVFRVAAQSGPTLAAATAKLATRPAVETRSVADVAVDFDSPIVAMRVAAQDELLRRASAGNAEAAAARRDIASLAAAAVSKPASQSRQTWLLWTLGRIAADEAAGDALFAGLVESKDEAVSETNRIQAVRILAHRVAGRSGDARRLPACVLAALADPAPRVRFAAMLAAASVADRATVPAVIDAAADEADRLVHYAAWIALRDLVPADELRGMLADERAGVRLAALLALLDHGRLEGPAVVELAKDTDERVARSATTWLANTGFGLDDPAAVLATIKRLDNRHVDYRLRLAMLRKLEGKQIDGSVRASLEQMYMNAWGGATLQSGEVVPQEKSQEIAAVLWAVKPDRRTAETAWQLLGHGWPMLADSVATGFSKLGADGLAVLAEKLPTADPARRDCGVEALAGYAAAGRGLTAGEPLVTMLAAAWDANPQPAFRAKVLACLAAIDPASWKAAENSRGRAEKLLLAAAGDPDPRLLGRVPAVATSLGIPTPKLAEPRPPAQAADVLARLKDADPARGAKLFADARGANCGACHRAGGHGVGGIGPELSDIGLRAAPAAILESILQPSATIIEGYRVSTLLLDDGRSLTGLVLDDTPDTVRVIDIEGRSTSVQKATIEERAVQQVSLMPAGYDRTLSPEELANLVAFLLAQKRPAGQVAAVGGPTNPLSWLEGDDLAAACANLGPDEKRKFREAGELLDLRPVCLPRGEWLHTDGKGVPLTHFGWPVAVRHGGVIHVVYTRGFSHSRPTEGDTSAARTAVARSTDDGRSFVPAQGLKNGCFDDIPFSMQPKAPAPAAGRPQWTNMIGVGGPRSAGVIDGKIVIASDDGVYRSEDDGRTWRRLEAAGLPAQIPTVPTFGAGPDLLVHPRQGLVSLGATTDHKLLVRTSKDHGQTWREREFQFDEPIQEPSGLIHDGRLILMPRTAAAIGTPKPGARGYYHYWSDPDWTTFQKQATNILAGERDTTDVKFNPVSKRFEAVVTNRMGGGPGHEADNCMTINLWSIAPDALLAGSGEWRFDGTLLRTEGREHDRGNALKLERDGMCPGGSVIAEDLGVQFIYVYLGHFQGPTGIFQVTRSLDTDRLRRFLLEDQ